MLQKKSTFILKSLHPYDCKLHMNLNGWTQKTVTSLRTVYHSQEHCIYPRALAKKKKKSLFPELPVLSFQIDLLRLISFILYSSQKEETFLPYSWFKIYKIVCSAGIWLFSSNYEFLCHRHFSATGFQSFPTSHSFQMIRRPAAADIQGPSLQSTGGAAVLNWLCGWPQLIVLRVILWSNKGVFIRNPFPGFKVKYI